MSEFTIIDGWLWPKKDKKCWPWLQNEKDLPQLITNHCPQHRVVVQAGGNCGFYIRAYARLFGMVYTFEPDHLNFHCLSHNVLEPNVIKIQSCLGNSHALVSLKRSDKNIGCYYVHGNGVCPVLLLDDLNLGVCDLIHLDIEGFEGYALEGAKETIRRCKPIIALEWLGHNEKNFNYKTDKLEKLLLDLGYTAKTDIYHERIFKCEPLS